MAYVPKSAQRKLQALQRSRTAQRDHATPVPAAPRAAPPIAPESLDIRRDSVEHCKQWDIFLNGVRQTSCQVANAKDGYVIRFVRARGRLVSGAGTEFIRGKVEIKWRELL